MPYIDLYIREDEYYKIYTGHTRALMVPASVIDGQNVKEFFQAEIHCVYKDGKIDKGRHLAPVWRTIMHIQKDIPGLEKEYCLIHLK